MRTAILLAVLLGGCGLRVDQGKVAVPPPERSDEAIAALVKTYGMTDAPTVFWYGKRLTCVSQAMADRGCDVAGRCWLSDNGAGCTEGETQDGVSLVSTRGGGVPIHETPLAHEVAHQIFGDAHTDYFFSRVDEGTAALEALGL